MYLKNHHIKLPLRNVLAKFRLGVSQINSHRYKFSKDNNLKLCSFCVRQYCEDEYHILFTCPVYEDLRKEYFKSIIPDSYESNSLTVLRHQFQDFMQYNQYTIAKYLFNVFIQRQRLIKSKG